MGQCMVRAKRSRASIEAGWAVCSRLCRDDASQANMSQRGDLMAVFLPFFSFFEWARRFALRESRLMARCERSGSMQGDGGEPPVELEHAIGYTGACSCSLFLHPNGAPVTDQVELQAHLAMRDVTFQSKRSCTYLAAAS